MVTVAMFSPYSKLAITANRKNIDEHIVLLDWSPGNDKTAVSIVDIDRETFLPRIGLQGMQSRVGVLYVFFFLQLHVRYKEFFFLSENGDDNMIMGLCIDRVSVEGTVNVRSGDDDVKELPPYFVLLCLTLEGKLVMFNVAR